MHTRQHSRAEAVPGEGVEVSGAGEDGVPVGPQDRDGGADRQQGPGPRPEKALRSRSEG